MRRVSGGASTADRVRRQTKGTSAAGSGGRVGCSSGRSARPGWLPVAVEFFFLAEEVPLPKKTILAETARPPRLETVCNLIYEIPLPPTAKSLAPLVLEAANQEEPARLSECRYPARYRTWVVWPTPGGVPGTGTPPALLYDLARFVNQVARDFTVCCSQLMAWRRLQWNARVPSAKTKCPAPFHVCPQSMSQSSR